MGFFSKSRTSVSSRRQISWAFTLGALSFFSALASLADDTLSTRRYSVLDGLSQSSVWAIHQDRHGFLWFGTEDGLNRFDGYDFKVYRPESRRPEDPDLRFISAIAEDASGALWLGGLSGQVERFDMGTERFTSFVPRLESAGERRGGVVKKILEDRRGGLLIATWGDGLYRLSPDRLSVERWRHDPDNATSLRDDRILSLVEDREGVLWVGTERGLDRFQLGGTGFEHLDPSPAAAEHGAVYSLFEDKAGRIWAGRAEGLVDLVDADGGEVNGGGVERVWCPPAKDSLAAEHRIVSFVEPPAPVTDGTFWAVTRRGGLQLFNPDDRTCIPLCGEAIDSWAGNQLLSGFRDTAGGVWVGTFGEGIVRLGRKKPFGAVHPEPANPDGLRHGVVWSLLEDHRGTVWIGTEEGGLYRREDRTSPVFERLPIETTRSGKGLVDSPPKPVDTVWSLLEDHRDYLWIGTRGGGLVRLDPEREDVVRYRAAVDGPGALQSDLIRVLYEDRDDTLWIGTIGRGLHRYDRERDAFEVFPVDGLGDAGADSARNSVTAILEDSPGVYWIGTLGGLVRFDGRGHFYELPVGAPPRLRQAQIRSLAKSSTGEVWIGTNGGGLYRFEPDGGIFDHDRTGDGLPNDVVYGILEDADGRMWLSTNSGLSRFDPSRGSYRNFGAADGLQSDEFNAGASFRAADGMLYFGGVAGYNAFDPRQIRDDPFKPPIMIMDFELLNRSVGLDPLADGRQLLEKSIFETALLELSHRDRMISFELAALSYAHPEQNTYSYRLENFDEEWIDAGKRRFATYTNLPPGEYVFRARGANHDGVWNDEGVALDLRVTAPYWQTWWFRGSLIALLVLAAWGFYRYRTGKVLARARELATWNRELERHNEDLEHFNRTISHDLRNPLLTIRAFLGSVERDALGGKTDRIRADIERISEATEEMKTLLDGLMKFSTVGQKCWYKADVDLAQVVGEAAAAVAKKSSVAVDVSIRSELGRIEGNRRLLRELFEHLLENAVRFRRPDTPPRIEVGRRLEGDDPPIYYVADNGQGIEPRHYETVFGLFDQLDPERSGTGLGLAMVKRIVEEMGGRVWVESGGEGQGSRFCFTLSRS